MMFCGVNEAFDNNFSEYRSNNKQSFINAQGDISKSGPYWDFDESTQQQEMLKLKQLHHMDYLNQMEHEEEIERQMKNINMEGTTLSELAPDSLLDADTITMGSDETLDLSKLDTINKPKQHHGHKYYINKFIGGVVDDITSVASSQDAEIYDHIKLCKYCRTEIKRKLKLLSGLKEEKEVTSTSKEIEHFSALNSGIAGYEIKEILIILLIGIVIIFILDLFVKIGQKSGRRR